MKTEELATIAKKAKEVGIAICGWSEKDFDHVQIGTDGSVSVHFSYYESGGTDYESVYLSEEDMDLPIEETVAKYKKKAQDEADKQETERIERERKEKIAREKLERDTYKKLKDKFERKSEDNQA